MRRRHPAQARKAARQLFLAMRLMHKHGFIHRDLHLDQILVRQRSRARARLRPPRFVQGYRIGTGITTYMLSWLSRGPSFRTRITEYILFWPAAAVRGMLHPRVVCSCCVRCSRAGRKYIFVAGGGACRTDMVQVRHKVMHHVVPMVLAWAHITTFNLGYAEMSSGAPWSQSAGVVSFLSSYYGNTWHVMTLSPFLVTAPRRFASGAGLQESRAVQSSEDAHMRVLLLFVL